MPQCSVPQCTNYGGHQFPSDSRLRRQWIIAKNGMSRLDVAACGVLDQQLVCAPSISTTTTMWSATITVGQRLLVPSYPIAVHYCNVMLRYYDTDCGRRRRVKVKGYIPQFRHPLFRHPLLRHPLSLTLTNPIPIPNPKTIVSIAGVGKAGASQSKMRIAEWRWCWSLKAIKLGLGLGLCLRFMPFPQIPMPQSALQPA